MSFFLAAVVVTFVVAAIAVGVSNMSMLQLCVCVAVVVAAAVGDDDAIHAVTFHDRCYPLKPLYEYVLSLPRFPTNFS